MLEIGVYNPLHTQRRKTDCAPPNRSAKPSPTHALKGRIPGFPALLTVFPPLKLCENRRKRKGTFRSMGSGRFLLSTCPRRALPQARNPGCPFATPFPGGSPAIRPRPATKGEGISVGSEFASLPSLEKIAHAPGFRETARMQRPGKLASGRNFPSAASQRDHGGGGIGPCPAVFAVSAALPTKSATAPAKQFPESGGSKGAVPAQPAGVSASIRVTDAHGRSRARKTKPTHRSDDDAESAPPHPRCRCQLPTNPSTASAARVSERQTHRSSARPSAREPPPRQVPMKAELK